LKEKGSGRVKGGPREWRGGGEKAFGRGGIVGLFQGGRVRRCEEVVGWCAKIRGEKS